MFRTEILIKGECHRTVRGNRDEAIEFARQVVLDFIGTYEVTTAGAEDDLTEALMDDDNVAWCDVALPVVKADYPRCPECDLMGSFNTGEDNCSWCEACGYDSEEA